MKFQEFGKEKFLFLYTNAFGELKPEQSTGLTALLSAINADDLVSNHQQVAYMLATVKHECAGTYLPIAEYGKGKGRKYGVPDPITGKTYYGRGYVQLTWAFNYKSMGKVLGVDLYGDPDLALQPEIAYQIMSYGMRKGSFTGVGLGNYIRQDKVDYVAARKIINGLDCAEKIAVYAVEFEAMLKECIDGQSAA